MAADTTNYNLVKPDAQDFFNVTHQNQNMDIIDTALKGVNDKVDNQKITRGNSNFAGSGSEVTIEHGLGSTPTSAYAVPKVNPNGYLGEVWIRMDETNIYVGNSGSFAGAMSWTAIL